jgi:hypothetical protein
MGKKMTPQPSSSYLKGARTKSEEAKMGRKKTHEKKQKNTYKSSYKLRQKKP